MSYVLGLSFLYNRYHADATIRIYADNFLVDELRLAQHINLKVFNTGNSHLGDKILGIDNPRVDKTYVEFFPEKLFLFEIDEQFLTKKITIEVENDNNNHTNGFMTVFSYIKFYEIFLIPKSLMSIKSWKKLAKRFHHLTKTKQHGYGVTKHVGEKIAEQSWPLRPESKHCVCTHGTKVWDKGIYRQNIGGSFTLKLPLVKKHKTVIIGHAFFGKIQLYTKYAELLSIFKALNI